MMITADQARMRYVNNIDIAVESELIAIMRGISNQSMRGLNDFAEVDNDYLDDVVEALRTLGYGVSIGEDIPGGFTRIDISWELTEGVS